MSCPAHCIDIYRNGCNMRTLTIIVASLAAVTATAEDVAWNESIGPHCELANPSSTECDAFSTTHFITNDEPAGLSFIGLNVDAMDMKVADGAPAIRMLYNGELLKSINPADETRVNFISVGMLVEDGTGDINDFEPINTLFMVFAYYGEPDFYDFVKTGTYTLEIPDGAFAIGGVPLKGYSVEYHYSAEAAVPDMTYQLAPAPENPVSDLETFAKDGFSLTFSDARIVQAKRRSGARLTTPSGDTIELLREQKSRKGFTYRLPSHVELDEYGEYVLTVDAGIISIDQPSYYEGSDVIPNFPGFEVTYYVYNSGVGITDVEADCGMPARVYSLDGRTVLENACLQDLKSLIPGIYITKGRKIRIR